MMDSLDLCDEDRLSQTQTHHRSLPTLQCPPNTAELQSSDLELDESPHLGDDHALPLYSFDSAVSSGFPLDSQDFALGISEETELSGSQALSLPSEPPELDLRDWILRHRIEASPENLIHEKSGISLSAKPKFTGPSLQAQSPSAIHHQTTREYEVPNVKEKSIFSRKNWEALVSSPDIDNDEQLHSPSRAKKKRRDVCNQADELSGILEPSTNNQAYHSDELKEETNHADKEKTSVSLGSEIEEESKNITAEIVKEFHSSDVLKSSMVEAETEISSKEKPHISSFTATSSSKWRLLTMQVGGIPEPSTVNQVSPKDEAEGEHNHGEKQNAVVSLSSETEDEPENNTAEIWEESHGPDLWSSETIAAEKENLLKEKSSVLSSRPKRISNNSFRRPLSDSGNLLTETQQSREEIVKWRCPKIDKKHFKPPPKQQSLDRWLGQAK
eukprot:Gb_27947 [translate_table: standard]